MHVTLSTPDNTLQRDLRLQRSRGGTSPICPADTHGHLLRKSDPNYAFSKHPDTGLIVTTAVAGDGIGGKEKVHGRTTIAGVKVIKEKFIVTYRVTYVVST